MYFKIGVVSKLPAKVWPIVDISLCMSLKFNHSHCPNTKAFFGAKSLETVFEVLALISELAINFMLILLPSTSLEGTVPATGTRPTAATAGDATTIASRTLGERGGFLYPHVHVCLSCNKTSSSLL